jgi:pimeloyl-ACP methyl ester carboxylesterase
MQVELVHTSTPDNVPLDGYLRRAAASDTQPALDLVICHHGVGSKFYTPSFFDGAGDVLLARGTSVLRVNNRGHDDAFLVGDRTLGAAYEVVDDCRLDITAWLDFAEAQGFRRIALWGHSLGAVKTIYFLAVQDDPRILCAVASSPPRFSNAAYSTDAGFRSTIQRAQELVDAGTPYELVQASVPLARRFAARTYLDKYGSAARYDYLALLDRIHKPLLLTVGSLEANNVSFAGLVQDGPGYHDRWPLVEFSGVDGADHSYTDRVGELSSAVDAWLLANASGGGAAQAGSHSAVPA